MPIAAASLDYVCALVRDEAGIALGPGKACLIESRLLPLARKAHAPDVDAFVDLARGRLGANLRRQVVAAMAAREASFFRDAAPFACLRTVVLPALIAARSAERTLAIWCGDAATGQDPYSVAMIVHEHFPELLAWQLTIIASDLSAEALARARAGRYNAIEINRGLPAALAAKYFERQGPEWELVAPVRGLVTFQELNLHKPWPSFPPLDIVLLRHVLADFDGEAAARVLDRARDVLRPDGYLFLGAAKGPMPLSDAFEPVDFERAGWYRHAPLAVR